MWERWDAWIPGRGFQNAGMNSLDHVAFGSVSEWMFRHILGINPNEHQPGYKHFTLTPRPGGSLTWARGHYHSIRGQIASSWRIENGRFTLCVTIPVGTTATVVLPVRQSEEVLSADGCIFRVDDSGAVSATVGSGQYTFVTKYNEKSLPQ